ncbi:MAG TPA: succinate--CoA ligase subunit alpha, partial [Aggregatilineales bacterium]|nr:succinate--CoA ligase subunit alpha [Aggregatilineales bacterium]
MAVWLTEKSKVVVQGLTGKQGQFYGLRNKAYGTNIVAGVNPKKAGENVEGIPIFATVADAVKETGADISFIIVPASIA